MASQEQECAKARRITSGTRLRALLETPFAKYLLELGSWHYLLAAVTTELSLGVRGLLMYAVTVS